MTKTRFLILFFFVLTLNLFSQSAKYLVDKDSILIGQQIRFTVELNDIELTNDFPVFNDSIVNGIEIIKKLQIDTTKNKDTYSLKQEYIITSWDSGSYYIPPFKINNQISTNALLINVFSVIIDKESEIKDIKEPLNPEYVLADFLVWILIALLLILAIYLFKKFYKKKSNQKEIKEVKKIIPPHLLALEELTIIEKKELWQSGKIKEYHSEISESLRKYIENRYNFNALELTTNEILEYIKNHISVEIFNELKKILEMSDLAKFAKSKPTDHDNIECINLSVKFVNQTKLIDNTNE